jgi:hypothetical protein
MKKNFIKMLAAIFFCGLTAMTFASCGDDDDEPGSDAGNKIVGMRIAYAVEFLDGYTTNEDYTVNVTWTDESGKDVTQDITDDFVKDVMFKHINTVATFAIKCTPKNPEKETHDIGIDYGVIAKPMNAQGQVAGSEFRDGSSIQMKGKSGSSYNEKGRTIRFKITSDNKIVTVE